MDTNTRYKVDGWDGIAWCFAGYPRRWEPYTYLAVDEETGEECEALSDDGEWVDKDDSGRVLMVMVGDDRKFEVDESTCTPIADDAYCASCGQIGCHW